MINQILAWDNGWLTSWNNFVATSSFWRIITKITAEYLIYAVPLILIIFWFISQQGQKAALKATFAGLLAWLVFANLIGKIINRPRPFAADGVHELFFHRPNYSFPSDHTAFLFALSASFYFTGYKKMAILFLILAVLIGAFRIASAIHYPTDIIAGAILGILIAFLVKLFDQVADPAYNYLINIAKKIKLA